MKKLILTGLLAVIFTTGLIAHAENRKSFAPAYEVSNDLTNWKRVYLGYKTTKQVCDEMTSWMYYRMIDLYSDQVSSVMYTTMLHKRCREK